MVRAFALAGLCLYAAGTPLAQGDRAGDANERLSAGKEHIRAGRFDRAIEELRRALDLQRGLGDPPREAEMLIELGWAYSGAGRNPDALAGNERALALCRLAMQRRCEAAALTAAAHIHLRMGTLPAALEQFRQALPLWEILEEPKEQAAVLSEAGWIKWLGGDSPGAIEDYNRALSLSRAAGDAASEGFARNNLGVAYAFLGDADTALEHYQQALDLRRAAGETGGEAQTLANMCGVYWRIGEYQKSLDVCAESAAVARTVNDRGSQALALDTMGLAYWSLGEADRALDRHREALALRRSVGDRQGSGITLNNLGWVHFTEGELPQARQHFDQALEVSRAVGDPRNEALALNNLGLHALVARDYPLAVSRLSEALRLRRAGGDRRGEAQARHNLGRTLAAQGEAEAATEHFLAARELFRAAGDRSSEANTLLALASHSRDRGELASARDLAEEAMTIAESLRTGVASQELRTSYLASKQNYYELYIDVLMQLHGRHPVDGFDGAALQVSERARARSLLEALAEARADIRQGVDAALVEHERAVRRRLDARERSRMNLLNRKHTPEEATAAEHELESLVQEYRDAQGAIRVRSPRYAALTQPQPLSLREIQTAVLDDRTVLLEYRLAEPRSYLWAVTPRSVRSYILPPRSRIEAASRRLYDLLKEVPKREARVQTERAAAELSAMLLQPVAGALGGKRLVIVADGILDYIPFAALTDPAPADAACLPRGRFCPLIVGHEIVSLPSASVLRVIRSETVGRRQASKVLAVFSDPVFDSADVRVGRGSAAGSARYERLPFSRREAEAIAALAPPDRTLKALDFDASRAMTARADLSDYRFVHFATHGVIDSERPELSGLVLSLVDRNGRSQDGFLRAHELYNLNLGADLVVLSACRTALGKEIRGEGVVGLTRAFMYAGSPRVIASLWDVRDAATAELMTHLYRGMLANGQSAAAALRTAQIAMWRSGQYQAPFYWAPFVLQGDWL